MISLKKLKKHICQADGYERDLLLLLYGSTGIFRLDRKTEFIQKCQDIDVKIPQDFPEQVDKSEAAEEDPPLRRMDAIRSDNLQQIVSSLDDVDNPLQTSGPLQTSVQDASLDPAAEYTGEHLNSKNRS